MENKAIAIQVKGVEKAYKLYDKPSDRLKEALGISRKKRYKEHYALKGIDMDVYQVESSCWQYSRISITLGDL